LNEQDGQPSRFLNDRNHSPPHNLLLNLGAQSMELAGFSASQRTSLSQERAFSPSSQSGNALVFVDGSLGDRFSWSSLAPGSEVYFLKSDSNAIDQVTQVLQGRSGVDSLQIISHGASGGIALGADWLTVDNLDQYGAQIQSWGQAMAPGGDILLYGCSAAQGVRGQAFLQGLSRLSGADVAGSTDRTGDAIGGNWQLESAIGEVNLARSGSFHYDGLLDLDLISKTYAISETAGGSITRQSTSKNGNFVVFSSGAGNLVSNDRNGKSDVFLLDRTTNAITLVSKGATNAGNGASSGAVISADGSYVAFVSDATDLAPGDSNTDQDVYIWNRATGAIELITKTVDTTVLHGRSEDLSISDDGNVVVFESDASDLVVGIDGNGKKDVFAWKRQGATAAVTLISQSEATNQSGDAQSADAVVSGDGTQIAFVSRADLGKGPSGSQDQVYLFDTTTGLFRLSQKADGTQGNGSSFTPVISRDGKRIAFTSSATNLTTQTDANASQDLFVWTRTAPLAGSLQLVSVSSSGTATGAASGPVLAPAESGRASLSDDGNLIAFTSLAKDLVANDVNSQRDIFLRNLTTGTTTLISGIAGAVGTGDSLFSSISGDGQTIAFTSAAKNLDPQSTSGVVNTFVAKPATGVLSLLSQLGTAGAGNGPSNSVLISGDGSSVVFDSAAINLVAQNRDSNGSNDVPGFDLGVPRRHRSGFGDGQCR
jgi:Tol biopolymer transport system component